MTKNVRFIGDSRKRLRAFPEDVKDEIGHTFNLIDEGLDPTNIKKLKGFSHGVTEIIADFNKNTYRAVYTAKIGSKIYVLHCFQKKSKKGIKTPKQDIDLIKQRLNEAIKVAEAEEIKEAKDEKEDN